MFSRLIPKESAQRVNDDTEDQLSIDHFELEWPDTLEPSDLNRDALVVNDNPEIQPAVDSRKLE